MEGAPARRFVVVEFPSVQRSHQASLFYVAFAHEAALIKDDLLGGGDSSPSTLFSTTAAWST